MLNITRFEGVLEDMFRDYYSIEAYARPLHRWIPQFVLVDILRSRCARIKVTMTIHGDNAETRITPGFLHEYGGTLLDNSRHGEWVWRYDNGVLKGEGRYCLGRRDGRWRWYRPNGAPWRETVFDHGELVEEERDSVHIQ